MITIPTGDLVGILSDVFHFASPVRKLPDINCVRVEWDGEMLHALATDRRHFGWSQWHPDDEHEEEHQEELFTKWGGADRPWALTISRDDANDLIDAFKLSGKEHYTPLMVDHTGDSLKVSRAKADGNSAITMVIPDAGIASFPKLRVLVDNHPDALPVTNLTLAADCLAHFAKVRPRGELKFRFTGDNSPVIATIGERFTAAVMPIRETKRLAATNDPDAPAVSEPEYCDYCGAEREDGVITHANACPHKPLEATA